jgi:hypothetical protein
MSPTVVLGLMGSKGSGKDTFADMLVADHGFTKVAFADALRDALLVLNPVIMGYSHYEDDLTRYSELIESYGYDEAKRLFPEVRRLLQTLGTDVVRNMIGMNTWVDILERRIWAMEGPVVVSDVRFRNEAWMVQAQEQGVTLLINRYDPLFDRDQHQSETDLIGYTPDLTVWNNHDLASLACDAYAIAKMLTGKARNDVGA